MKHTATDRGGHHLDPAAIYDEFFCEGGQVSRAVHKAHWIPAQDRADVVHDIFLAVIRARFRGECQPRTFVTAVTRNILITHLRKKRPRLVDLDHAPDLEAAPQVDEASHARLLRRVVKLAWSEKSAQVLEVYARYALGEIDRAEVARILDRSERRAFQSCYDFAYRSRKRTARRRRRP